MTPFSSLANDMNIGGIGISATNNLGVRVVGIRLDGSNRYFTLPVTIIDRFLYGLSGVVPDVSKIVGAAVRDIYTDVFSLSDIPFLFTVGWNANTLENYTAHAIDNNPDNGLNNPSAYLIYQFKNMSGVWSNDYAPSFNYLSTSSLAINSDIDPLARCALNSVDTIELKSLFTQQPDIILDGLPSTPSNKTINLTYMSHLSIAFLDQLFFPLLQKNNVTNSEINGTTLTLLSTTTKNNLQNKGWVVN